MVLLVADDKVAFADDGADDAEIALESGGEGDDGLLVQETSELLLQLQMHAQRPVEKARAGAAGAVLLHGVKTCLHDFRMRGKSQIVVGTEHDAALAFHHDLDILPGFQRVKIWIDARLAGFLDRGHTAAFFKQIHD